jgi:hypothetical protein
MPEHRCPLPFRSAFLGEPAHVTIEPGERLYKLVSVPLVRERALQSPWWIRQPAFTELHVRARRLHLPLRELVRAHLAIAVQWNPGLDVLWIVHLAAAVEGWEGRARSQRLSRDDPKAALLGGGQQVCVPALTWRQIAMDQTAHISD